VTGGSKGREDQAAIGREYRVAEGHEGVSGDGCLLPVKFLKIFGIVHSKFGAFYARFKVQMP